MHPELGFFNQLSGKLTIELSEPPRPIANLLNLQAPPTAKLVRLSLAAEFCDRTKKKSRSLTSEELKSIAFRGAQIRLKGDSGDVVLHKAPNGSHFTVQELLRAIEQTEQQTRGKTEWLGGIDVHHCYFEGIHPTEDGVWEIYWGS